jgi:hypothetical protein
MSTNPRNPEFFPRMKVRGARRRRLAPFQAMKGSLRRLSDAAGAASASLTAYTYSFIERPADERTD